MGKVHDSVRESSTAVHRVFVGRLTLGSTSGAQSELPIRFPHASGRHDMAPARDTA